MRTHLRESMLALLLIGILATGCDTGTKKASENSITFDSISVEKTYHLLDNPDNPNCNLEIKFVYPRKYSDKEVLKNLQRQFVSSYFGENYEQLSPEEAVRKYTDVGVINISTCSEKKILKTLFRTHYIQRNCKGGK